ncbi:hypothetical protein, partial [Liquorilactobacillus vini]
TFFDHWSRKDFFIIFLIGFIFWLSYKNSYEPNCFYYYLFIIGAKNVNFKKILQAFLISIAVMVGITIACALVGAVPNLRITRVNDPVVRFALGMIYPSDFAARAFYWLIAFTLYRKFKFSLTDYISTMALTLFIYFVTDTRIDLILMLLLIVSVWARPYLYPIINGIGEFWLMVVVTLFIGLNMLMAYAYSATNSFLNLVNKVLSGRLIFGHLAFKKYNVTYIGQFVYQEGNGGIHHKAFNYFYIDSSFIRILLMEGIFVFLALMFLLWFLFKRYYQLNLMLFVIALILIVLSSVIDQHLNEMSFNVVLLSALANLDYWQKEINFSKRV